MSPMLQIVLAGIGTYLFRVSFIALAGRIGEIPARVETMLSMIPPAVLAAIAADSLLFSGDSLRGLDEWHIAIVVTALVSYKTKSIAMCLAVGMPLIWGLAAIGG
jgi:branched-subunit amino acid transport protein